MDLLCYILGISLLVIGRESLTEAKVIDAQAQQIISSSEEFKHTIDELLKGIQERRSELPGLTLNISRKLNANPLVEEALQEIGRTKKIREIDECEGRFYANMFNLAVQKREEIDENLSLKADSLTLTKKDLDKIITELKQDDSESTINSIMVRHESIVRIIEGDRLLMPRLNGIHMKRVLNSVLVEKEIKDLIRKSVLQPLKDCLDSTDIHEYVTTPKQ